MAGWKEYLDGLVTDTDRNLKVALGEYQSWDEELEKQKGLVPAVLRGIVKAFRFMLSLILKAGATIFPDMLPGTQALLSGRILEVPKASWDATVDRIGSSVGLDAEGVKIIKSYYQTFADASPVVQGLSLILILTSVMSYLMGPGMGKVLQSMAVKMRPGVPSPGDVLGARGLDPALDARIWEVGRRNGIPDKDIELLFAATYQRIPEAALREIYFRHDKGKDWAAHRLGELGYTPERTAELMSVWPAIPPISDIIMMMGREAFEPAMIARFGLDQAQPGQLSEFAAQLGLSPEWATRYWVSHWEHPGLQAVLDMYHRDIIAWEDVYEYMSVVEIPPYWREKIRLAAFNVITRVDARRMYGTGTLSQVELFDKYRFMGYSPDDALKLVDFTIKYETGADKDFTREDIIRAYSYRDIGREEALAYLMRIGYLQDAAVFYLDRADLDKSRETLKTALVQIKDRFTSNLMTEGEVQAQLVQLGMSQSAISSQIISWRVIVNKNSKLPSKSDFDKFLRSGMIGEIEYRAEMGKLGYSKHYTDLYLAYIGKGMEEASGE